MRGALGVYSNNFDSIAFRMQLHPLTVGNFGILSPLMISKTCSFVCSIKSASGIPMRVTVLMLFVIILISLIIGVKGGVKFRLRQIHPGTTHNVFQRSNRNRSISMNGHSKILCLFTDYSLYLMMAAAYPNHFKAKPFQNIQHLLPGQTPQFRHIPAVP